MQNWPKEKHKRLKSKTAWKRSNAVLLFMAENGQIAYEDLSRDSTIN